MSGSRQAENRRDRKQILPRDAAEDHWRQPARVQPEAGIQAGGPGRAGRPGRLPAGGRRPSGRSTPRSARSAPSCRCARGSTGSSRRAAGSARRTHHADPRQAPGNPPEPLRCPRRRARAYPSRYSSMSPKSKPCQCASATCRCRSGSYSSPGSHRPTCCPGQPRGKEIGGLLLIREQARCLQPAVVLLDLRVEEAHGPGEGHHQFRLHQPDQPPNRPEFTGALGRADLRDLLRRVLIADRMPGRAGHLHGHHVQPATALQGRAAHLANREPGVVAVQQGDAPRLTPGRPRHGTSATAR